MLKHADKLAVPESAGIFYFCDFVIFNGDCDIVAEGPAKGTYYVFNFWHIFFLRVFQASPDRIENVNFISLDFFTDLLDSSLIYWIFP